MTTKRLILAILAAFITTWATDFLIHAVWMSPVYGATKNLWRTDSEMETRMGWLFGGQFLAAAMFVLIWSKGFADRGCAKCAVMYGMCMGLFSQATTLITYAIQPFPLELIWKWFVAGTLQGVILGLVTFAVTKPAAPAA